jgi:hypothetical protein
MVRRTKKISAEIITLVLSTGIFVVPLIQLAYASSSWRLGVDLEQTTFGTERAVVTIKGPFGYQDTRSVQTGPSVSVSFSVPDNAVPPGYNYQVCVSGSLISAILPNCQYFVHGSGDESIQMTIPG